MRLFFKSVSGAAIAIAMGALVACNEGAPSLSPAAPASEQAGNANAQSSGAQTQAQPSVVVLVECEKDVPPKDLRSKISVNGNNLQAGGYRARVTSPPGSNPIFSNPKQTVGDEVEFDFDSNTEPGATRIPADYIKIVQGPDVQGDLIRNDGRVFVGAASVECTVDN
jgi:hypothetical protein